MRGSEMDRPEFSGGTAAVVLDLSGQTPFRGRPLDFFNRCRVGLNASAPSLCGIGEKGMDRGTV